MNGTEDSKSPDKDLFIYDDDIKITFDLTKFDVKNTNKYLYCSIGTIINFQ